MHVEEQLTQMKIRASIREGFPFTLPSSFTKAFLIFFFQKHGLCSDLKRKKFQWAHVFEHLVPNGDSVWEGHGSLEADFENLYHCRLPVCGVPTTTTKM